MNMKAKMLNNRAKYGFDETFPLLNIKKGDTVADLGSGGGFYTFQFAEKVGDSGKVYAVDADSTLLNHVKARAMQKSLGNVETILASSDSANLPDNSCDIIFTRNMYHHLDAPKEYFKELKKSLKQGGRLFVIDWKKEAIHAGHGTEIDKIIEDLTAGGYIVMRSGEILNKQSFVECIKK